MGSRIRGSWAYPANLAVPETKVIVHRVHRYISKSVKLRSALPGLTCNTSSLKLDVGATEWFKGWDPHNVSPFAPLRRSVPSRGHRETKGILQHTDTVATDMSFSRCLSV